MGRYSSVQAYADNNPNMRQIQYNQEAKGGASSSGSGGPVKTEKVVNPYGSTAGAGSGEFHVYRHARAREMARIEGMEEEEKEEKLEAEHEQKLDGWRKEEEKRLGKKRKKRARGKAAKLRKKNLSLGGVKDACVDKVDSTIENEFDYKPLHLQEKNPSESEGDKAESDKVKVDCQAKADILHTENNSNTPSEGNQLEKLSFQNDGSFMEQMRKQMKSSESASGKETNNTMTRVLT